MIVSLNLSLGWIVDFTNKLDKKYLSGLRQGVLLY